MKHYSFLFEADQINLENPSGNNGFESLIKSKADIPASLEQAKKMEIIAKVREIEAKTKEAEAKAKSLEAQSMGGGIDPNTGMPMDPNMGGGIDPNTGMSMDPNAGIGGGMPGIDPNMGGGIDPNTGMPMDPNAQQNDPLFGLGDKSAPPDPNAGMGGGMDPMTGMPMQQPTAQYTAIGRAYKLKQLFEYLVRIKTYLRDNVSNEVNMDYLYNQIQQAFEMFKIVINNLKIYKDQIDSIIVMYYELIKLVLEKITNTTNEGELHDILDTQNLFISDDDSDDE